ncbi:fibronectin type III domain-containing protein [Paenibacillus sp. 2TAF8]|uniref:fibronectin type III domain-containing protein n=1 Tax=Paenibacillus sp. 2TAF8 TaxID=3233020 RepID=UPI003F950F43
MGKRNLIWLMMILVVLCLTPAGFISAAGTKYIDIGSNVSIKSLRFEGSGTSRFELYNDKGEFEIHGALKNNNGITYSEAHTVRYLKFTEVESVTGMYYGAGAFETAIIPIPINKITSTSPIPLPVPTNLTGVASDKTVSLKWNKTTNSDVIGYNVYLNNVKQNTTPINSDRYVVNGLNNGTSYNFSVTSVSSSKESTKATISITPIDNVAPAVPKNVVLVPGNKQIEIDWSDNTESDLAGYNIYRDGKKINTTLLTSSFFLDTEREVGIPYTYQISAVDLNGNESVKSASVTVQISDTTPPQITLSLVGKAGDSLVTLTWVAESNSDITGYKVYKDNEFIALIPAPETSFEVKELTNGTNYNFTVTAVDSSGNELGKSETINVTPHASDKTKALLTIYVSGGQIKEYDLTMVEVQAFIEWFNKKEAGTGSSMYKFTKNWNKGPFKTRTEYVIFDKILSFDVDEYEVENNE